MKIYYECGICDHIHPWDWSGDCRENQARLDAEQLDKRHGSLGWELRSWADRVLADRQQVEEYVDRNNPGKK